MGTETVAPDTLPVYKSGEVPEPLRTETQLKSMRLKPAEGQEPVAWLSMYRRGHGWGEFALYDPADAAKMRPLSAKQQRAKEVRRTCPKCGAVCAYIVYQRCQECRKKAQQEAQALQARTCWKCRRVSLAAPPEGQDRCLPCWVLWRLQKQFEEERLAVWRRTCPGQGCGLVTATDEEIAAVRADRSHRVGWVPRWCPPCKERDELERLERARQAEADRQRAEEERRLEVLNLAEWARQALAENVLILDTETTGLDDDARIVEISVITADGNVVLDTLVNPGTPIPVEASDIHGITDSMVAEAPSFGQVLASLTAALAGKRCLIYNKSYDVGRLRHELLLHHQASSHPEPEQAATAWFDGMTLEDAMIPYSNWCGDWSDYWGNYTWQPLNGGHRALGDCQAVADCLRAMGGLTASDPR